MNQNYKEHFKEYQPAALAIVINMFPRCVLSQYVLKEIRLYTYEQRVIII